MAEREKLTGVQARIVGAFNELRREGLRSRIRRFFESARKKGPTNP